MGAPLPLPNSLAMGAKHVQLDADLRTSPSLGALYLSNRSTTTTYYPFAEEDGGRLDPMAAELTHYLATLVMKRGNVAIRRFQA
jgi:hypothetical protein